MKANTSVPRGKHTRHKDPREVEMANFDSLPPALRAAVRSVNFSINSRSALEVLSRGASVGKVLTQLASREAEQFGNPKVWGPDYRHHMTTNAYSPEDLGL